MSVYGSRGSDRDARGGGGGDRFGSERFGSEREDRNVSSSSAGADGELVGWVVWVDRGEGSFRAINSESEFSFSLEDCYAHVRVGDEVTCKRETCSLDPVVYDVRRLSNREPPLSHKCWNYGRIDTINDDEGWIVDDDTKDRVEMQRNQLSQRFQERDPVMYLRMSYRNRSGRTKSVAALVEEDPGPAPQVSSRGNERSGRVGNGRDTAQAFQEGWITSLQDSFGILRLIGDQRTYFFHCKQSLTRFEDLHKFDCIRCILKPDGNATQVEKLSFQLPLSPPDWRKGEIIELDSNGGLLVDTANPSKKFEFKVHALKGRGIHNLDPILYLLVDSPKYGKNFVAIVEIDPAAPPSASGAVGGGIDRVRGPVSSSTTRRASAPKVHMESLFVPKGAPEDAVSSLSPMDRHNKRRSELSDARSPATRRDAPQDRSSVRPANQVEEGWITSLQDSFGICRLIGSQATRFFHKTSCLSNFHELRNGDCVRCALKGDGGAQFVEKLPHQLPLEPPDWKQGRVLEMGDIKGVLVDTSTNQEFDFKNSVIKGTIQSGTDVLFLLADSPKYGKNFVATVVPDRGLEGNKTGLPQSSGGPRGSRGEAPAPRSTDELMGWVVQIKGEEGTFRGTEFEGEWKFNVKDADDDVQEGDEVSCRREQRGSDPVVYDVKRLTTSDPPLPRKCWTFGKIEEIDDTKGWIVADDGGARIEMPEDQLSQGWREQEPVMFLRMSYGGRSVAALLRESDGGGVAEGAAMSPQSSTNRHNKRLADPRIASARREAPQDQSSAKPTNKIEEGWITSLQDSFGICRLIGDQATHFFHMKSCLSNFDELRNGDCVRCSLKPDGNAQFVEKLSHQLPLEPPDWKQGRVVEMGDIKGVLADTSTNQEFDFKNSVIKGTIQSGTDVLYLLADSPKYGKDFVATVVPDRGVEGNKTGLPQTSRPRGRGQEHAQRYGDELMGWVVQIKGEEGSFRGTEFEGEWKFNVKDADADVQEGDEVSCRREQRGSDPVVYSVKRLTTSDPPLPRKCWTFGKIESIDDTKGWIVTDDGGERIEMQDNQLFERWREDDPVMFLRMSYPGRSVAVLVRDSDAAAGGAAAAASDDDAEPQYQEGWITSTQESFGFVRLIGDQRSHFFHMDHCRTNFREMRIGDCLRCSLNADGQPKDVERLSHQLPLVPPDWKKGKVIELDDQGGRLTDEATGKDMEFTRHAVKGRIATSDTVVYLLVDSPKYGKDYLTMVKPLPDESRSATKRTRSRLPSAERTSKAQRLEL